MKLLKSIIFCFLFVSVASAQWEFKPSELIASKGEFLAQLIGVSEFEQLLLSVDSSTNQQEFEKSFFDQVYKLEQAGQLNNQLIKAISKAKQTFKFAPLQNANEMEVVAIINVALMSELYARGYYNSIPFKTWNQLSKEQIAKIGNLPAIPYFNSEIFKETFKQLTHADFMSTRQFETLYTNDEALKMRLNLIAAAKREICISVWGFYDDQTGAQVADQLIAAHNRGVSVKVLVDSMTAKRVGYHDQLMRMKQNGVKVVFWQSTKNPFYGMHAKFIVVDQDVSIEGGRNIGDYYLKDGKWSDFDVVHNGNVGKQNYNLFAKLWNKQVRLQKLKYDLLSPIQIQNEVLATQEQTASVMHFANPQGVDPIYELSLYAIAQAKRKIMIANAYVINTPALKEYLKAAIKRGVKVTVFSNSPQSIDEPMISIPIVRSLKELSALGASVYFKLGETLHTKMMIVDNDFAWVGSYNLHPRSFHYEVEKAFVTIRKSQVEQLTNEMSRMMTSTNAKKMNTSDNWGVPDSTPFDLFFLMFFNQL